MGNSSYNKRCRELRPTQITPDGNTYYPSWDNIDRIRRARTVFLRWARKGHDSQITT